MRKRIICAILTATFVLSITATAYATILGGDHGKGYPVPTSITLPSPPDITTHE